MGKSSTYWHTLIDSIQSLWSGLRITFSHILKARKTQPIVSITNPAYFTNREEGIATIEYPYEMQPIPDTGRYRLHNEIDDCIVCDKCAKVCPVDCITIEPIKAIEEIGKTSDGTPKRIYAAKFDIDMGKCCFCGLCTTVCPTECLTMTKVYDFSVTDIREHHFAFAEMNDVDIEAKKKLWEEHQKNKQAGMPPIKPLSVQPTTAETPKVAKPLFRPKIKPAGPSSPKE